ncbi:hypothetical protein H6F67_11905 [Microcoleus sp. FACHB-1515]|uniref:hypothetical protein n=1 Tax=Cyanophyceae TaxID=3028117 RepID=UPI0016872BCE|nr:hypothetical protein [Microcoleus sp. FACHB-1515]MBD2090558.1 hypothetical protein [Microcoleus sp. FACHB-1515]
MKTQRRILERARQGDPAAIATWLTCCLHRRGLSATATPEGDCLHLLLESAQIPDQQSAIATILHELDQLAPTFQALHVTGKQTGQAQPVWDCRLDLPAAVITQPARSQSAPGTVSPHRQRFVYTGMTAIAALIAVNVVLGFRSIFRLGGESRAFANQVIPTIVEEWNATALIDRASPTLIEATPPEDLQQTFLQLSQQFGAFQSAEPASCNLSPKFTLEGKVTTSRCEAAIDFENSTAIVELDLVQQDANWQIDRFSVQPDKSIP